VLSVRNVEVYYGPIRALGGVSVEVAQGQIVALLGGNGAGKTTLLKTICGLLDGQPETGSIEFLGRRLNGLTPEDVARLGIAYVQEGRAIFAELTVDENLTMGGYLRRDSKALCQDLERTLSIFPALAPRRRQLAGTLSGGEQQMLAIAIGLMARPRLMFLDEPSLGLAPFLVRETFRTIRALCDGGTTILLVEQNARMALQIADQAYVLEGGRIALAGDAGQLMEDGRVRELYLGIAPLDAAGDGRHHRRQHRWR
jgi:branched-chain amino acid transport system ATP-binding protein